jgi:hypothetical protein
MIRRVRHALAVAPPHPVATEDDPPTRRDNLHAIAQLTGWQASRADSAIRNSATLRLVSGFGAISADLHADPSVTA